MGPESTNDPPCGSDWMNIEHVPDDTTSSEHEIRYSIWWMFGYSSTSRDAARISNVRSVFGFSNIVSSILFNVYPSNIPSDFVRKGNLHSSAVQRGLRFKPCSNAQLARQKWERCCWSEHTRFSTRTQEGFRFKHSALQVVCHEPRSRNHPFSSLDQGHCPLQCK
ncbi:hypothetical protein DEU56DRAFT_269650 [Suillus clintonianus]|uniref:uncharacterized protein n=1 Tax=Suillus clintonianus TaxID=1904413 RepID=UPI001B86ED0F|nr:uncharacterized protein DEU56DRAFT_269650 [Suillus clintonianus]KAG2141880.1 hypothetical protein DEU56DRAFT_269650 [Suillus clintonianus]